MIPDDDTLDDFALSAAARLDLTIAEAFRPGVLDNLRILRGYANLVVGFQLDEGIDATSVFEP